LAAATVGVVFDLDGVLVDSGEAHRRAWQRLGDEVGTPFSDALFARTFGQRNADIVPAWLGNVAPDRADALGARKEALYRDLVRAGEARAYPRVPGVLAALRAGGARLAVASSGPRENVALLVDRLGVAGLLDAVVSSEDVRRGKPDPEPFLRAAERLGVVPVRCAVVEDAVHGVEAARRAGMLAIAVLTSTPRDALAAAGAELFVGEVGDLDVGDLLARLAAR